MFGVYPVLFTFILFAFYFLIVSLLVDSFCAHAFSCISKSFMITQRGESHMLDIFFIYFTYLKRGMSGEVSGVCSVSCSVECTK